MRLASLLLLPLVVAGCGDLRTMLPAAPSAVSVAAPPSPPSPPSVQYGLSGIVSTESGRPIAAARVSVDGGMQTMTDEQGRYVLTGVPSLLCEITVSKEGFETLRTDARIDGHTVKNFVLRQL